MDDNFNTLYNVIVEARALVASASADFLEWVTDCDEPLHNEIQGFVRAGRPLGATAIRIEDRVIDALCKARGI